MQEQYIFRHIQTYARYICCILHIAHLAGCCISPSMYCQLYCVNCMLHGYTRHITTRSCPEVAQRLPKSCPNSAQRLPTSCPTAAQRLPKSCPKAALKLPKSCPKVAQKYYGLAQTAKFDAAQKLILIKLFNCFGQ